MALSTLILAALWGIVCGLLAIHLLANLLAASFCLHGILMTRWKRLAHKAPLGVVKYSVNLRLLTRVSLYTLLFAGLLYAADLFIRSEFRFRYAGLPLGIFLTAAIMIALYRLRAMIKRSQLIWRMSHEFDYAERRQRTRMLKG